MTHTGAPTYTFDPCLWSEHWLVCKARFIENVKSRSEASYHYYENTLSRFFAGSSTGADYSGPPKRPEDYLYEDVMAFMSMPCKKGMRNQGQPASAGTKNTRLAVLSSFYKHAARFKIPGPDGKPTRLFTGDLPTDGIKAGKASVKRRSLSPEEMERFFSVIPTDVPGLRDRAIFACFFWTARRCREILDLRWKDLEQTVIRDGYQTRTAWIYHFKGKGRRHIDDFAELPEPARLAIWRYLEASGRMATIKDDDPLFLGIGNGGGMAEHYTEPLWTTTINQIMKKYCRAAGLPADLLSVHCWRHTAAQQRLLHGEDLISLKETLRHTKLDTTWIYAKGLVTEADTGAKRLEAQFANLAK